MDTAKRSQCAFSLVELSIVLVILGLLVGGVLAGKSLIRAAELRSVTTEYNRYITAVGSFRDRYQFLPGDIPATPQFANLTQQGNGDGMITPTSTATTNEAYAFWQNLAGAGLIEGSYTATVASACCPTASAIPGTTNPKGKMSGSEWGVVYLGNLPSDGASIYISWGTFGYWFAGNYQNVLVYGAPATSGDAAITPSGNMTPEEAWNVDTKMDDGVPNTGRVMTFYQYQHADAGGAGKCSYRPSPPAAAYQLSDTGKDCSFTMKIGY